MTPADRFALRLKVAVIVSSNQALWCWKFHFLALMRSFQQLDSNLHKSPSLRDLRSANLTCEKTWKPCSPNHLEAVRNQPWKCCLHLPAMGASGTQKSLGLTKIANIWQKCSAGRRFTGHCITSDYRHTGERIATSNRNEFLRKRGFVSRLSGTSYRFAVHLGWPNFP
jgi:hypothetical protein